MSEPTEQELKKLKEEAFNAHANATSLLHKYACACPLGGDRIRAFEIYQNVRIAVRVEVGG
jgi:hypothetical protein